MFEPDLTKENAIKFSRFDEDNALSTCSRHPIVLEDKNWLTAEHYYSASIVMSSYLRANIEKAESGLKAAKMADPWYRFKIKNFKKLRAVLMTRALYTKVQMYDEVKDALMATGDQLIIETSLYDYYWGIGRDARGVNQLGLIWMDIRKKLTEQAA
ncbi:NADAR family protein [Agaribacterium haliotis]|uniref:NADAR family protein n=1 Tax=Agaribacterium haliotis TaxID=2013869 RepID=UPI000BB59F2F|nr:NADAR family protein [Agaribacterium haliotis]